MEEVKLEREKMQGIIATGHGNKAAACYILLEITTVNEAKKYLNIISHDITPADKKKIPSGNLALQLAISSAGLRKLQLPDSILSTFSREFLEGMTDEIRSEILGDKGKSDPAHWQWGGPMNKEVHLLLLCYASDEDTLRNYVQKIRTDLVNNGVSIIGDILYTYGSILTGGKTDADKVIKEHFGFRDGISTPIIESLSNPEKEHNYSLGPPIKAGEFILGYPNEYNQLPESPKVPSSDDPNNFLPPCLEKPGYKDLGKNGTYLVFRQFRQDVFNFWKYLKEISKEPVEKDSGDPVVAAAITLGAKMIGRWPTGASLANNPEYKDQFQEPDTEFLYYEQDEKEVRCPYGAHIRRTNPRDKLFSSRLKTTSVEMVRKHQILRRGRIFGQPLVSSMNPEDMLAIPDDDGIERGLHFICLNTDISKQFEFIQNVWINNPVFADLYNDRDPIISSTENNDFTCQANPIRRKYKGIPQFTWVTGGGYFFLPGICALKFIANS